MLNISNRISINSQRGVLPPAVLTDGSTVLWVDSKENITKNGSDLVSSWGDKSGNGNDLVQATETNKPTWNSNGVLFDGVDNFMKAVAFTLIQPEFIYIVFKQVTWTSNARVFDGNSGNSGTLVQNGTTPNLNAYAGAFSTASTDLTLDTYGIVRVLFNGASSTFQVNDNAQTTGNFGAANMGGFQLGFSLAYSNIEVKEVIIRNVADSAQDEGTIYNYLADKYSI